MDQGLLARARQIIAVNLALKPEESLLVVADDITREVGKLFYDAAEAMGHDVQLIIMPEGKVAGQEPPAVVAVAMAAADVALCPTSKSITHTQARINAVAQGTRVVTMPGVTMDMLREGASCADYSQVEARTAAVSAMLTEASTARILKDGHEMVLSLAGRPGVASPGVYRTPGASGNFPSGEAYIAPVEDGAHGTMVVDGSMVGIGALTPGCPLTLTVEAGRLMSVEGGDNLGLYAERLQVLFAKPENGTIAELGVGTNEQAKLSGIILEDEKLYGTVHLAFGTNASFGGVTHADCHYDGIILKPTLYLDDTLVIQEGEFVA